MESEVFIWHERLKRFPPAQMIYIIYRRLIEHGVYPTFLWIWDKLVRRVKGFSPPQVSEVIPGLFVGGQQNKLGLRQMRSLGITAIVNMREESDDAARGVTLDQYLWLPITDDTAPALDDLERGSLFIASQLAAGRSVYVHCAAGVGRAPTLAAAYLVRQGMNPDEAWALIRKVRPFVRPTPSQIEGIVSYAVHVTESVIPINKRHERHMNPEYNYVDGETSSVRQPIGLEHAAEPLSTDDGRFQNEM